MQFFLEQIRKISDFFNGGVSSVVSDKFLKTLPVYIALFLGLIIAYQIMNLTWKLIFPTNDVVFNLESASKNESSKNIFINLSGDPFIRMANQAVNLTFDIEAPPTTLSLRLYGIRYSNSGELDAAILGFDPKNQRLYKTNEVIADDIILEYIEPERVVISRGGIRESVTFDKDTVLSPEVTQSLAKSNKNIDVKGIELNTFNKMINFQPYFSNGTLKGYQLYPGKESEFFKKSGLQPGDVLVAVNGLDIKDPSVLKELSAFGQLKLDLIRDDDDFSITVKLN